MDVRRDASPPSAAGRRVRRVARHLTSESALSSLAHAAMGLRLLLLMGLTRATHRLVMVVQLLHGACFALFWTAAVDYANASAPAELRATAQSAVSTAYYLIGAGCGSVLFGAAYERGGARATYAAGIAIAGANYAAHLHHFEAYKLKVADGIAMFKRLGNARGLCEIMRCMPAEEQYGGLCCLAFNTVVELGSGDKNKK